MEDEDIDSINNIMNEFRFGYFNSSFKTLHANTIKFDTNSNKKITENNDSDILWISDEDKDRQ